MRRLISVLVLIGMTLFALSVNGVEGKVKQVTLNVEGMFCPSCPAMIKTALKKLDGVFDTEVSYKDAKATVKY